MNKTETTVTFLALSGPDFDIAIQGDWKPVRATRPWLLSPRLKYYMRKCGFERGPDLRTFFLALTPARMDDDMGLMMQSAIGIIELQVSPYGNDVVWLKYITVDPAWQRKGVAKRLLALMAEHLKLHPRRLARSRASDEGADKIQDYIDQLLDTSGIEWTQTGREKLEAA